MIDTTGLRVGFSGPVTALHVSPEAGTPAAVRDRLNAKLQHGRAYVRDEVPERHHFRDTPRGGDVVVIMDEGWLMATSILNRGLIQREWGEHGWAPDLPSMKAIFLLAGPEIPAGLTIPEVEKAPITTTRSSAALVMILPVRCSPPATATVLSRVASHCSRTRDSRNTS